MRLPLILLTTAGLLQAVPVPNRHKGSGAGNAPATTCKISPIFKPKVSYTYQFSSKVRNMISGTSNEQTGMTISGRVKISSTSKCEFIMRVMSVQLKALQDGKEVVSPHSVNFKREMMRPIVFSVDGKMITGIKSHGSDSEQVVNIKRGIISSLQVDEKVKSEEDVHGRCPVKVSTEGSELVKTKNLNECSNRISNILGVHSTSFASNKTLLQPLQSTSVCRYRLIRGSIGRVTCDEKHIFRPFSANYDKDAGAMTTVEQTLTRMTPKRLKKHTPLRQKRMYKATSLAFKHQQDEMKPVKAIIKEFEVLMNRLVRNSPEGRKTSQHSAREFMSLVQKIRDMDDKRLRAIFLNFYNCESVNRVCKKGDGLQDLFRQQLLDAIQYCGTEACTSIVRSLINAGSVTGERANMLLLGISMVKEPTRRMIKMVHDIALTAEKRKVFSRQAVLTLGTLLRHFCASNHADCHYKRNNPVTMAENYLAQKLARNCRVKDDAVRSEKVLFALKAIKNAGRPRKVLQNLLRCAKGSDSPKLQIAAFDALKNMPCSHDTNDNLLAFLEDPSSDSEMRIHAFQTAMRCPEEEHINRVIHILEKDGNSQVASYLHSSLTNMRDSSNPKYKKHSELIKKATASVPLRKVESGMMSSKSMMAGMNMGSNSGVFAEADTIFHSDSYLPRSFDVKLAANMLGVDRELIELYVRTEGLEKIVEQLFSPNGVYPDSSIIEWFNSKIKQESLKNVIPVRARRSLKPEQYENKLKRLFKMMKEEEWKPTGHLSLSLFGQEVRLVSYEDIMAMVGEFDNDLNVIELLLKLAKGGDKTFSKSQVILDMTHAVPTGAGLPLNLKLESSAVASVRVSGKMDIRNMFWGKKSLDISGFLRPSAVVDLTAKMGVEGPYLDTGLFVNSSLFVDHALNGKILYREGQKLQINVDPPKEPVTLFNISTTPFLYTNEKSIPVTNNERMDIDKTVDANRFLGLGLQVTAGFPMMYRNYDAPYFPLTGPAYFGMRLLRTDRSLTSYQFLADVTKMTKNGVYISTVDFSLSTPKTKIPRRVSAQGVYKIAGSTHEVSFTSENRFAKAMLKGDFDTATRALGASASLDVPALGKNGRFASEIRFSNTTDFEGRTLGLKSVASILNSAQFSTDFQYVRKNTGFVLKSAINYFNDKRILSTLEWNQASRTILVKLDSNQIQQSIELQGELIKEEKKMAKTVAMKVTGTHFPSRKSGSIYASVDLAEKETLLTLKGQGFGKAYMLRMGRVIKKDESKLMTEFVANDVRKFEAFLVYLRNNKFTFDLGVDFDGNVFGGKTDITPNKYCFQLYRTKGSVTSIPVLTCLAFENNKVKQKLEMSIQSKITKDTILVKGSVERAQMNFDAEFSVLKNDVSVFGINQRLVLNSLWNSGYTLKGNMGKYNAEFLLQSKDVKGKRTVQMTITRMDQKVMSVDIEVSKASWYETVIKSTASAGDKTVELMRTSLFYGFKADERHLGFSTESQVGSFLAKYVLKYDMQKSTHTYLNNAVLTKGGANLLGWKFDAALDVLKRDMTVKTMIDVWRKTYNLEFDLGYKTSEKSVEITVGMTYAPKKKCQFLTTLTKDAGLFRADMKFIYLNNKKLTHFIQWNQDMQELSTSFEVMPKIFIEYAGSYKNKQLITSWRFKTPTKRGQLSWRSFFDLMKFSTSFTLSANEIDVHLKVNTDWEKPLATIELSWLHEEKYLLSLSKSDKYTWSLQFQNREKSIFSVFFHAHPINNDNYIEMNLLGDRIFRITFRKLGNGRSIFGLYSKLTKVFSVTSDITEKKMSGEVELYGKNLFSVSFDRSKSEKVLKLTRAGDLLFSVSYSLVGSTLKLDVSAGPFAISSWATAKVVNGDYVLDMKVHNYPISFIIGNLRKSLSFNIDLKNRKRIGAELSWKEGTLTFDLYSLKIRFVGKMEKDESIVFAIEHTTGTTYTRDFVLKYTLGSDISKIRMEWDEKMARKVIDTISTKVKELIAKYIPITTMDMKKKFDEYYTLVINKLTQFVSKGRVYLNKINIAEFQKAAFEKIDQMIVKLADLSMEYLKKLKAQVIKLKSELPELRRRLISLIKKTSLQTAMMNKTFWWFTSLNKPIVDEAINVIRSFKIQDKTLEKWVQQLVEYATRKGRVVLLDLKLKLTKGYDEFIKYVMSMSVPCTKFVCEKNVENTIKRVKELTRNYDVKYTVERIRMSLMALKISGKTIPEHFQMIKKELRRVPVLLKKSIEDVVRQIRLLIARVKKVYGTVVTELQPLTEFLKLVKDTVWEQYSPIARKLSLNVREIFEKYEKKMELFKTLKANFQQIKKTYYSVKVTLTTFFEQLVARVKSLKFQGRSVNEILKSISAQWKKTAVVVKRNLNEMIKLSKDFGEVLKTAKASEVFTRIEKFVPAFWDKLSLAVREVVASIDTSYLVKLQSQFQRMYNMISSKSLRERVMYVYENIDKISEQFLDLTVRYIEIIEKSNLSSKIRGWVSSVDRFLAKIEWKKYLDMIRNVDFAGGWRKMKTRIMAFANSWRSNISKLISTMSIYQKRLIAVVKYIIRLPEMEFTDVYGDFLKFRQKALEYARTLTQKVFDFAREEISYIKKVVAMNRMSWKIFFGDVVPKLSVWAETFVQQTKQVFKILNPEAQKLVEVYRKKLIKLYRPFLDMISINYRKAMAAMNKWIEKYGDMSLEMFVDRVTSKYEEAFTSVKRALNQLQILLNGIGEKVRNNGEEIFSSIKKHTMEKIVPELMRLYKKVETKGWQYISQVKEQIVMTRNYLAKWYEENKGKTLRDLYEIVKSKVYVWSNKNIAELKAKYEKLYGKVDNFMTDVLIPELKKEGMSILNQSLKALSKLYKATVKVYGPYLKSAYSWIDGKLSLETIQRDFLIKFLQKKLPMAIRSFNGWQQKLTSKYVRLTLDLISKVVESNLYKEFSKNKQIAAMMDKIEEFGQKMASQDFLKPVPEFVESVRYLWRFVRNPKMDVLRAETSKTLKQVTELENKLVARLTKDLMDIDISKIPSLKSVIDKIISRVVAELESYANNPIKYFWEKVEILKKLPTHVRSIWKQFYTSLNKTITEVRKYAISLVNYVDKSFRTMYEKEVKAIEKLRSEYSRIAWERFTTIRTVIMSYYKGSLIEEVVTNEIWTDISNEIQDLPIVKDIESGVNELKKRFPLLTVKISDFTAAVTKLFNSKWIDLKSQWKLVMTRWNAFIAVVKKAIDETTLQQWIEKAVNFYNKQYATLLKLYNRADVQKILANARDLGLRLREMVVKYMKDLKQQINTATSKAQAIFEKVKAFVMAKYKEVMPRVEKVINDFKRTSKEWQSKLRAMWMKYKRMTIVDFKMKLENLAIVKRARTLFKRAVLYLNAYVDKVTQYYQSAVKMFEPFVSEVRSTLAFIWKYYKVRESSEEVFEKISTVLKQLRVSIQNCLVKDCFNLDLSKRVQKLERYFLQMAHNATIFIRDRLVDLREMVPELGRMMPSPREFVARYEKYMPFFTFEKGSAQLNVPHVFTIKNNLRYHVKLANNTIYKIANTVKSMEVEKYWTTLRQMSASSKTMLSDMYETFLQRTDFIKEDLRNVYRINKEMFVKIVNYLKQVFRKYRGVAEMKLTEVKREISTLLRKVQEKVTTVYTKFLKIVRDGKVKDLTSLFDFAVKQLKSYLDQWVPKIYTFVADVRVKVNLLLTKLRSGANKAINFIRQAILDMYKGKSLFEILKPHHEQVMKILRQQITDIRSRVMKVYSEYRRSMDPEMVRMMKEYYSTHKALFEKYSEIVAHQSRFTMFMARRIQRHVMRAMQLSGTVPTEIMSGTASYLGNGLAITFDNKFVKIPMQANSKCNYILAINPADKDFALLAAKDSITIKTTDMLVSVYEAGKIVAHVKNSRGKFERMFGMPVEGKSGWCKRSGAHVECFFKESQFRVSVDMEHFVTTVTTNMHNYGQVKGLLGSNNEEAYDEVHMKNGQITSNLNQASVSFELSKTKICRVNRLKPEKNCAKKPSPKCRELFKEPKSIFSLLFRIHGSEPFYQACLKYTADCKTKTPPTTAHCKLASAYTTAITQLTGFVHTVVPECSQMKFGKKTYNVGDEFVTKPNERKVDVVLMISLRDFVGKRKNQIANMLRATNARLARMDRRYTVVGFGGAGIHESAHSHTTRDGELYTSRFGEINQMIKNLPYNGAAENTNDVYDAVSFAGNLNYRPGSSRVFIMINADTPTSNKYSGSSILEASFSLAFESNATLVLFDRLKFKALKSGVVVGQTPKQVFLNKKGKNMIKLKEAFPVSPLEDLIKESRGAMFDLKAVKLPQLGNFLQKVVKGATTRRDCRKCRVYPSIIARQLPSNANSARAICVADIKARC